MIELGRAVGNASSRDECESIIKGLMATVRQLREETAGDNETVWLLLGAIEGVRESMPRFDEVGDNE